MSEKIIVPVDFTEFPELHEKLKYFARREYLDMGSALRRILAIAVQSHFNLGDQCMDPWPFVPGDDNLFGGK